MERASWDLMFEHLTTLEQNIWIRSVDKLLPLRLLSEIDKSCPNGFNDERLDR